MNTDPFDAINEMDWDDLTNFDVDSMVNNVLGDDDDPKSRAAAREDAEARLKTALDQHGVIYSVCFFIDGSLVFRWFLLRTVTMWLAGARCDRHCDVENSGTEPFLLHLALVVCCLQSSVSLVLSPYSCLLTRTE